MTTKKLPDPSPHQLARHASCQRAGRPCADRIQHQWKGGKRGKLAPTGVVSLCGFIIAGTPCGNNAVKAVQGRLGI